MGAGFGSLTERSGVMGLVLGAGGGDGVEGQTQKEIKCQTFTVMLF